MNMASYELKGWEQSYLPISAGDAPDGTVSLLGLPAPDKMAKLVPILASTYDADIRNSALTLLHFAIAAVANLLIAPLALDGVTITVKADQLGIVLAGDGSLTGIWIGWGQGSIHSGIDIQRLGGCLAEILNPLVEAVHVSCGVGKPGIRMVMFDAIARACQRMEHSQPVKPASGWVDELLVVMGDDKKKAQRSYTVRPDDGPPIEMLIPRVCCVLGRHSTCHSCPSCPQHSDEDRIKYTEEWLRSLDDDGFREETGRLRVVCAT